jgi:hypothetical protein
MSDRYYSYGYDGKYCGEYYKPTNVRQGSQNSGASCVASSTPMRGLRDPIRYP